MNNILNNRWLKLGVSFFCLIYGVLLSVFAYATFLYELVFNNETTFIVLYIILNGLFLGLMLYTRKQILTRIQALLLLPIVFALLVFNFGNWIIFVPAFIVALVIFFACAAGDNTKALFGTVYLIMYVVGIIVFLLVRRYMGNNSVVTVLTNQTDYSSAVFQKYDTAALDALSQYIVSPDGKYRFYLVEEQDNNSGRMKLYVEPNGADKKYRFFTLKEKGRERTVYTYNKRGVVPAVEWVYNSESGNYDIRYQFADEQIKTSRIILPEKQYFDFLLN